QYENTISGEIALEAANIFKTFLPDAFGHERLRKSLRSENLLVHPDDEDFLIVGAVEDTNFSALGNYLVSAPEIVMIEFFRARRFEGMNVAALWIDTGHYMLDDAVFARSVHGLQDDEQRPAILRIEFFLHATEKFYAVVEKCGGAFFVMKL